MPTDQEMEARIEAIYREELEMEEELEQPGSGALDAAVATGGAVEAVVDGPDADGEVTDEAADHTRVSNEGEVGDAIEADPPSFGEEGAPDEEGDGPLESVDGYEYVEEELEVEAGALDEKVLLDAWYAEFADPVMRRDARLRLSRDESIHEVVIGSDQRKRIQNTTAFPWRTICSLKITAADDSQWIGTGWLVGPRTVITAGHCVFIRSRGGWVKSVEVIPGRDGSTRPYGECVSRSFRSVTGWTRRRRRSHDYGAIILPRDCRYGDQLGWFGYGSYSSGTLKNLMVNLSGYPGDKQPTGTQWFDARKIKKVNARSLVYNIDTAGGQSGAPVWWLKDNGQRYAVGIHTNGHSSGNSATRIVKPVFDNIKHWKAEGA